MKHTPGFSFEHGPQRTSAVLRQFAAELKTERVSIGEIVTALGDRGLGVLIAIFALPNVLPSTLPFGNIITGIPPIFFSIQLMLGGQLLMLPQSIARLSVKTTTFQALVPRVASVLAWFERLLRPRVTWVTGPRAERIIGLVCLILAIVSSLPIPFGHQLPALALVLLGLGLIEGDGLAILFGATIGVLGVSLLGLVIFGLAHGVTELVHARHFLHRL